MNIKPSLEEMIVLLEENENSIIPMYAELPADLLSPVAAYLKLSKNKKHSFLFESVEGGARIGRYSFIGVGKDAQRKHLSFCRSLRCL